MKNLDKNRLSVQEMSEVQMRAISGGNPWLKAIAATAQMITIAGGISSVINKIPQHKPAEQAPSYMPKPRLTNS